MKIIILHIFPNPTSESISVSIENSNLKRVNYTICDINGRLVKKGKIRVDDEVIDVSLFEYGIYLMQVNDKHGNLIAANKIVVR